MSPTVRFWRLVAIALSVFNVAGAGFALAAGEGWHTGIHLSLAIAFAFAAQRLKERSSVSAAEEGTTKVEELQDTVARQAAQLTELQERVDFAERMLTQIRDRQKLGGS